MKYVTISLLLLLVLMGCKTNKKSSLFTNSKYSTHKSSKTVLGQLMSQKSMVDKEEKICNMIFDGSPIGIKSKGRFWTLMIDGQILSEICSLDLPEPITALATGIPMKSPSTIIPFEISVKSHSLWYSIPVPINGFYDF